LKNCKYAKTLYKSEIVDSQTGEVLKESKFSKERQEPEYLKMYLNTLTELVGLTKGSTQILLKCLQYMSFADEGNIIRFGIDIKKEICESCNISIGTLNNAISNFAKQNIFIRKCTSVYIVNPRYFGRGRYSDLLQVQKAIIDYKNKTLTPMAISDKSI
jgi:hypothetical protein